MAALLTTVHTMAVIGLFHSIRKQHEREEEWIHFTIVTLVALTGLLGMILGGGKHH